MKVTGAHLDNGMLHVELVHELPEAAKPRTIETAYLRGAQEKWQMNGERDERYFKTLLARASAISRSASSGSRNPDLTSSTAVFFTAAT